MVISNAKTPAEFRDEVVVMMTTEIRSLRIRAENSKQVGRKVRLESQADALCMQIAFIQDIQFREDLK